MSTLQNIFYPKSIAVIGASSNPEKLGYACFEGILKGGYKGKLYPVNPNARSILGVECRASAADLPEGVDLAIVVLPAEKVPGVLETLAERGVKGAMVPASGFAEIGGSGLDLQRTIANVCSHSSMRVLGPNIPGFINADASLVATLAGGPVGGGPLAIVSQAGSVGYALVRSVQAVGIEFGRFICLGNQADVSEAEILEFLLDDPQVHAIGLYIESVKAGRQFLEVARRVGLTKPIVALKGGRTPAGLGAIFSHTASISSPEHIYRAAFRKAGIVPAESLRSLGMLTFALGRQQPARGNRIGIVTSLAGMGVIAADSCERLKLKLPEPSEATKAQLREVLPAAASMRNPIDLTGDVTPTMLSRTVEILSSSGEYDGIMPLVMGVPASESFGNLAYARMLEPALRAAVTSGMAVSVAWVMDEAEGAEFRAVSKALHACGVPVSEMPEDAVQVMAGLVDRGQLLFSARRPDPKLAPLPRIWTQGLQRHVAEGNAVLTEHAAKSLLHSAGLRVAESRLATDARAALAHARAIGLPVVMKLQSPQLTHKSEAGGVALDLRSDEDVLAAYDKIMQRFKEHAPGVVPDGVSLQPMIQDSGIELVCGIAEDPQFGKYVLVGLGGVTVELFEDFSLRLLPVGREEIEEMLAELKSALLLAGYRGRPPIDRADLVRLIAEACRLAMAPEIAELEINPLLATASGSVALDARIRLHAGAEVLVDQPAQRESETVRGERGRSELGVL